MRLDPSFLALNLYVRSFAQHSPHDIGQAFRTYTFFEQRFDRRFLFLLIQLQLLIFLPLSLKVRSLTQTIVGDRDVAEVGDRDAAEVGDRDGASVRVGADVSVGTGDSVGCDVDGDDDGAGVGLMQ